MLIRWIAPLLIGAVVVLMFHQIFVDAGRVVKEPVRLIEESAKNLRELVSSSEAQLKKIESDAISIKQAAEKLPKVDLKIPLSLSLPDIVIPPLKFEVPVVTTGTETVTPPSLDVTVPTISVREKSIGVKVLGIHYGFKVPEPVIGSKVDTLIFPSFDVPTINVTTTEEDLTIPDLKGISIPLPEPFPAIGQTLSDIRDVVNQISATLADAGGLAATLSLAKEDLAALEKEAADLRSETALIARTWAKPVFWLLVASGMAVVLSYFVTTLDNLRHSLRLITGKED